MENNGNSSTTLEHGKPVTLGGRAQLSGNYPGLEGIEAGAMAEVRRIRDVGVVVVFDGEDFERMLPMSYLSAL